MFDERRQNYKRLAAATMAALFVGNVVPETVGMETQQDQAELMRTATLCTGQEIQFNRQDPRSIVDAFKQAIAVSDFSTAIAIRRFLSRIDSASFSNEVDNIIIAAMKNNPKAEILKEGLSGETQLLLELDSVTYNNYVQQYEKCRHLIYCPEPDHMTYLLRRTTPKTESGKSLKEDLLREFSLYE